MCIVPLGRMPVYNSIVCTMRLSCHCHCRPTKTSSSSPLTVNTATVVGIGYGLPSSVTWSYPRLLLPRFTVNRCSYGKTKLIAGICSGTSHIFSPQFCCQNDMPHPHTINQLQPTARELRFQYKIIIFSLMKCILHQLPSCGQMHCHLVGRWINIIVQRLTVGACYSLKNTVILKRCN